MFNRIRSGLQEQAVSLDDKIKQQAYMRADNERAKAIEDVKRGMMRDQDDKAYQDVYSSMTSAQQGMRASHPEDFYALAASKYRDQYGAGPMESLNTAMAENDAVRYGVIGTAGLGGGALATAGAQKIAALMGMLQEADETEMARDQPLTS